MSRLNHPAIILVFAFLVGWAETDTYPITGADCGPGDPVKELDASSCAPGGVSGMGGL